MPAFHFVHKIKCDLITHVCCVLLKKGEKVGWMIVEKAVYTFHVKSQTYAIIC